MKILAILLCQSFFLSSVVFADVDLWIYFTVIFGGNKLLSAFSTQVVFLAAVQPIPASTVINYGENILGCFTYKDGSAIGTTTELLG